MVALVAAYALVIQSLLAGILGTTVAARAASGEALPGYALCLTHNEDSAPAPSDNPVEHSSCMAHCLAWVSGGQALVPAPAAAPFGPVDFASHVILWAARDRRIPSPVANLVAQPRGPPLAA
ncbi:MAG: hypothetical protein ACXWKP_31285 [Bradyrhizobium sp.]